MKAGVLEKAHTEQIKDFLQGIEPMPAAFEQKWVKNLPGNNLKSGKSKMDLAEQVGQDIQQFKKKSGAALCS